MEKHFAFLMVGINIAYQNVGGSSVNGNPFLEWYQKEDIDIGIVGEVWKNKNNDTQFRRGYDVCTGEGKWVKRQN